MDLKIPTLSYKFSHINSVNRSMQIIITRKRYLTNIFHISTMVVAAVI